MWPAWTTLPPPDGAGVPAGAGERSRSQSIRNTPDSAVSSCVPSRAPPGEHWVARSAPRHRGSGRRCGPGAGPAASDGERRDPAARAQRPPSRHDHPRHAGAFDLADPDRAPRPRARRANSGGTRVDKGPSRKRRPRRAAGRLTEPSEVTVVAAPVRPSTDSATRAGTCTGNSGGVNCSRLTATGRGTRHSIQGCDPGSSSPTHAVEPDPSNALDARNRPSLRNRPEESATTGPEYPRAGRLAVRRGRRQRQPASALQSRAAGGLNSRARPVSPSPASTSIPPATPRARASGATDHPRGALEQVGEPNVTQVATREACSARTGARSASLRAARGPVSRPDRRRRPVRRRRPYRRDPHPQRAHRFGGRGRGDSTRDAPRTGARQPDRVHCCPAVVVRQDVDERDVAGRRRIPISIHRCEGSRLWSASQAVDGEQSNAANGRCSGNSTNPGEYGARM